jgi:phosphoglycolate phosphatase
MVQKAPLLVFDLDGTLADTAGDLVDTLNVILQGEGASPLAYEDARQMIGAGVRALLERGLTATGLKVSASRMEELFTAYLAHYEAHIADKTRLFPGVLTALDRFESAGWGLAVCTNKLEHPAVQLLTLLGVAPRFRAICGQNTFGISKPDARILLSTIERAGGDPVRSFMVGDSKADIETARNAGVSVVAVDFGYTDQHVSVYKPDKVISHFDDLWDAVHALSAAA